MGKKWSNDRIWHCAVAAIRGAVVGAAAVACLKLNIYLYAYFASGELLISWQALVEMLKQGAYVGALWGAIAYERRSNRELTAVSSSN